MLYVKFCIRPIILHLKTFRLDGNRFFPA